MPSLPNIKNFLALRRNLYLTAIFLDIFLMIVIIFNGIQPAQRLVKPLISPAKLEPLHEGKSNHEVMGFAPHWTFDKIDRADFNVLTTLAYFGIDVLPDGNLNTDGAGYKTFKSSKATNVFRRAHSQGTRVVLTITQMKNHNILSIMDSPEAQETAIHQAVNEVKTRGIDGINVDFEYTGNPGQQYREKFSEFVANLTSRMHQELPQSKVTVSVYASSIKEPKIYDIKKLSEISDGIFMMAYDFAVATSDQVIPTAPLYGHKSGKYWYDISTAVEDFLAVMPPEKLILGVPWYGYNYLVYEPGVKAQTRPSWSWRGRPQAQTYASVIKNIKPDMTGWDEEGQVGWRAYYVAATGTWRMIFIDDEKSLARKYDFAKEKNLKGVGVWALGFEDDSSELWALLQEKFGKTLAKND